MNKRRFLFKQVVGRCLLLSATALSIGCGSQSDRALEQMVEQSYQVEANASLSVRNTDGSIRIYGSEGSELKLQAIKRAYTAERLNKISVDVSAQSGFVSIETKYPPKPKSVLSDRSGTVDYIILLPQSCTVSRLELANGEVLVEGMRGENINATLVTGRLMGRNCFGDARFVVTSGQLDLVYDWWEKVGFLVDAQIVNGNAQVFVPRSASFHLMATAPNGKVASEFGESQDEQRGRMKKIDATIGADSQANLKVHANAGSIQIAAINFKL